jgi:hypothetical protein
VFKVFDCNGIYWVGGFDDLVDSIENVVTCLLVECSLMVEIEEVVNTNEEPLCVEVQQFGESQLMSQFQGTMAQSELKCYLFSTSTKLSRVEEMMHKLRGVTSLDSRQS